MTHNIVRESCQNLVKILLSNDKSYQVSEKKI